VTRLEQKRSGYERKGEAGNVLKIKSIIPIKNQKP